MVSDGKGFYEDEEFDQDTNDVEDEFPDGEMSNADDQEDDFDDDIVEEIDFSQIQGKDFKSSYGKFNKTYRLKKRNKRLRGMKRRRRMPLDNRLIVNESVTLKGKRRKSKTIKQVLVPDERRLIVEGVDRLILGKDSRCDSIRNIGYYKCRKLKELVITMNNNSPHDFNLELFNPSMPLDYLFSTSGNLNNKVQIAGGVVSYSDVLFNILANPTHVVNAKFTFSGVNVPQQINQPLIFKQKNIQGEQVIDPLQLQLTVDLMQVATDIVFFDFQSQLNRPFLPNGMDVIQYKVLAGNTVTFSFFYRQKDLRKFFFNEARKAKKLLT